MKLDDIICFILALSLHSKSGKLLIFLNIKIKFLLPWRILWISEAREESWKFWVIPLFHFSLDIGRRIMFELVVQNGRDFEDIFCVYYCWLKSWPFSLDVSWHISYSLGRVAVVDFGGLMFLRRGSDVAQSFTLAILCSTPGCSLKNGFS